MSFVEILCIVGQHVLGNKINHAKCNNSHVEMFEVATLHDLSLPIR